MIRVEAMEAAHKALHDRFVSLEAKHDTTTQSAGHSAAGVARLDDLVKAVGGRQDTHYNDIMRHADSIGTLASKIGKLESSYTNEMSEIHRRLLRLEGDRTPNDEPDLSAMPSFIDIEPKDVPEAVYRAYERRIERENIDIVDIHNSGFATIAAYRAKVEGDGPRRRLDRWRHRADRLTVALGKPLHRIEGTTTGIYDLDVLKAVFATIDHDFTGDTLTFAMIAKYVLIDRGCDADPIESARRLAAWEAKVKAADGQVGDIELRRPVVLPAATPAETPLDMATVAAKVYGDPAEENA
jgi:hypothetical protein